MEIPKTTKNKPYVEFRFYKNGKIKLSASPRWCGGKNSGFMASDGTEGNTCEPKDLTKYIDAFKLRKIKNIEKEISSLQTKLAKLKKIYFGIKTTNRKKLMENTKQALSARIEEVNKLSLKAQGK